MNHTVLSFEELPEIISAKVPAGLPANLPRERVSAAWQQGFSHPAYRESEARGKGEAAPLAGGAYKFCVRHKMFEAPAQCRRHCGIFLIRREYREVSP